MPSGLIRPPSEIIRASRSSRDYSFMRYPLDLGPHGVVMNFHDYSFDATRSNTHKSVNDTVTLPVPANLQDNMTLKVGASELGSIGGLASDLLNGGAAGTVQGTLDSINTSGGAFGAEFARNLSANGNDKLKAALSTVGGAASSGYQVAKYFAASAVDSIAPGVGLALSTANGTTINPHVTVEFDGVGLKTHTFEWTFAPQSEEEAEQLRRIIKLFKQKALPKYKSINDGAGTLSRGLLTYPSLVNIFFVGIDPAYFWYFKPCMISAININYAPQGVAVARGGKPAIVTMQMELQESTIHTAEDYDG